MELKKLDLDDDEKAKISKISRQNKFQNCMVDVLYEKDTKKKINIILDCFRFLRNLSNQSQFQDESEDKEEEKENKKDDGIQKKINTFLEGLNEIETELLNLKKDIPEINFGLSDSLEDIEKFIIKNYGQISYIVDIVYEFGKKVEQYNPEETQGYY